MRIAYIAPYKGPGLLQVRPSLHNLSLAARVKIELIAELLQRYSYQVEIISQGDVDKYECQYYPSFNESTLFNPDIPVFYASALPIRFINGFWSSIHMVQLFRARHKVSAYDLVIIYNMKRGHIACAQYAKHHLGLPVILEYEDDVFLNVIGEDATGVIASYHRQKYSKMLKQMSGCIAVSPYLLSQLPASIPKLLLRGVVGDTLVKLGSQARDAKKNLVVFSGTHEETQGLEQLIKAWTIVQIPEWELHIAGRGPITSKLERMAEKTPGIVFHGILDREENARLLCMSKIGMNPQDVTKTPGNVFPFKIIEYLAAGTHVITTPRGYLEPDLEAGVSYITDNKAETIADGLKNVIRSNHYERTAEKAAIKQYGPTAVSESLNRLIKQVVAVRT